MRINDAITWATHQAAMRAALGGVSGEDAFLQGLLDAATNAADTFIDNDWTDGDGNDIAIPAGVTQGVWEWCKVVRNAIGPNASSANVDPGIKSLKVGDNVVTYANTAAERVSLERQALDAARVFWWSAQTNKSR